MHIAPLVSVKVIQGRRRALNAVPVNSMMLPVRFVVHGVHVQLFLVAKEETAVASIVQVVGRPKTAVRNVIRAMPAHLEEPKVFVQNARMVFIKTKKAKLNAANAHWENRTSMPKQHAVIVTLVRLAAAKVFVQLARMVFIETAYLNQNALNAHWENRTSMPKQHAVVVT